MRSSDYLMHDPLLQYVWCQPTQVTINVTTTASSLMTAAEDKRWQSVNNQLVTYSAYQNNWDQLGGVVATGDAFRVASLLVNQLRERAEPPPTATVLTPNGSIQLEWWSGENVVQAEIETKDTDKLGFIRT